MTHREKMQVLEKRRRRRLPKKRARRHEHSSTSQHTTRPEVASVDRSRHSCLRSQGHPGHRTIRSGLGSFVSDVRQIRQAHDSEREQPNPKLAELREQAADRAL